MVRLSFWWLLTYKLLIIRLHNLRLWFFSLVTCTSTTASYYSSWLAVWKCEHIDEFCWHTAHPGARLQSQQQQAAAAASAAADMLDCVAVSNGPLVVDWALLVNWLIGPLLPLRPRRGAHRPTAASGPARPGPSRTVPYVFSAGDSRRRILGSIIIITIIIPIFYFRY